MNESILDSVKKCINGLAPDATYFDPDLIMAINTYLSVLTIQLGVGPEQGFYVTGKNETWQDLLGNDYMKFIAAKSYIMLRAKLQFDPPSNSTIVEEYNKEIAELEWRLTNAR